MGDVLLSRIIKYYNGTLFYDDYYRLCQYIIMHYQDVLTYDFDELCEHSQIDKRSILSFLNYLGFDNYTEFKEKLMSDDMLRNDQIKGRMLSISYQDILDIMNLGQSDDIVHQVQRICQDIYRCYRIVLIGGLFPTSLAIDFQTDLITLDKSVIQYHHFDKDIRFTKHDFVIFITSSGRSLKEFFDQKKDSLLDSQVLVITQNQQLEKYKSQYMFCFPGKFDGVIFNYKTMAILDLIRMIYFQTYFTDK